MMERRTVREATTRKTAITHAGLTTELVMEGRTSTSAYQRSGSAMAVMTARIRVMRMAVVSHGLRVALDMAFKIRKKYVWVYL